MRGGGSLRFSGERNTQRNKEISSYTGLVPFRWEKKKQCSAVSAMQFSSSACTLHCAEKVIWKLLPRQDLPCNEKNRVRLATPKCSNKCTASGNKKEKNAQRWLAGVGWGSK